MLAARGSVRVTRCLQGAIRTGLDGELARVREAPESCARVDAITVHVHSLPKLIEVKRLAGRATPRTKGSRSDAFLVMLPRADQSSAGA